MSIKNLYPSSYPTTGYDFANGKRIPSSANFSRGSIGTYIDENGLIKTALPGEPRFDHDPVTGESLGLLVEESRTNIFLSSTFASSLWIEQNITKKSSNNPAPDGTNTAVLIGGATSTNTMSRLYYNTNQKGATRSFSFYAKATSAGQSAMIGYYDNGPNQGYAFVNLDNGNITYSAKIGDLVATATPIGSGWWRCQLVVTPAGSAAYYWMAGNAANGDIYIWGAQLETGSSPTSYIPTSGSAVTRAADSFSAPLDNFRSGKIYFTPVSNSSVIKLRDSINTPEYSLQVSSNNSIPAISEYVGNIRQYTSTLASLPAQSTEELFVTFNFDKDNGSIELSTNATDDSNAFITKVPNGRALPSGYNLNTVDFLSNVTIRSLNLWDENLSSSSLISLSKEFSAIGNAAVETNGIPGDDFYVKSENIPTLDLNFADNKSLVDNTTGQNLVTFSRNSIGTYVDSNGVIQTAAIDAPRFDHDPDTLESLGLLVEEERTNYVKYSNDIYHNGGIEANTWNIVDITTSSLSSPYGVPGVGTLTPSASIAPDNTLTASYFRAVGVNYLRSPVVTSGNNGQPLSSVVVNLNTGTITSSNTSASPASIVPAGNGWYRISWNGRSSYIGSFSTCSIYAKAGETGVLTLSFYTLFGGMCMVLQTGGTAEQGVYVWGAQIEPGSFPTSYIPTPATFTSRNSTATYYDSNGVIQTAAIDVARNDAYLPDENGVFRPAGLLIEGSETNYISSSANPLRCQRYQVFTNASNLTTGPITIVGGGTLTAYVTDVHPIDGSNCYIFVGSITGVPSNPATFTQGGNTYNGSANRFLVGFDVYNNVGDNSNFPVLSNVLAPDGVSYAYEQTGQIKMYQLSPWNTNPSVFSVFVKAKTATSISISNEYDFTSYNTFNFTTGTWDSITSSTEAVFVQKLPNGWFRIGVLDTRTRGFYNRILSSGSYYCWGFQYSSSYYMSSYIPTAGSTVTRAADSSTSSTVTRAVDLASISGTNFSSWFNQNEGSFVATSKGEGRLLISSVSTGPSVYQDTTYAFISNSEDFGGSFNIRTESQAFYLFYGSSGWTDSKIMANYAGAYSTNEGVSVYNGNSIPSQQRATITSPLQTDLTHMWIGRTHAFNPSKSHIKRLSYWPTRLPDTTLQTLTSTAIETWDLVFDSSLASDGTCAIITLGTTTYEVDWGDGTPVETINAISTYTATHTYVFPTTYAVKINVVSGAFRPFYSNSTYADQLVEIRKTPDGWTNTSTSGFGTNLDNAWTGANNLTKIDREINTSGITSLRQTWQNCSSLTSFPLIDTSSSTQFYITWGNCSSLTSFPLIDTSNALRVDRSWDGCKNLVEFPLLNVSNSTNFEYAWSACSSLIRFPLLDTSKGENFFISWRNCISLTSFPPLNFSSGENFGYAWNSCTSLTAFPANMFDTTGTLTTTAFNQTFTNCALTSQSIGNILSSLDTNGQSNITLTISGGTNASSYDWTSSAWNGFYNLTNKGWTISYNDNLFSSSPLDLQFAATKTLDSRITFTRASTGTYVDSNGVIQTAAADTARFDHDPETGESLGLLIEESRSNQIVNSQVFTSGYNQSGLNSITQSTSITTPQGLTDGVGVITESVGGTVHQVYTASTTQVTGYLTYSVFVKPNGRNYCVLCTSSFTHDLINGTTLGSASGEFVSATTVPFPNGWVRCTLTRNHSNTFDQFNLQLATGLNNTSYSGDGTSGVYIWGAQREAGTFPTSYIPTSGSTVTRAADVASITGTNFSSWYEQSEGTLYSEINAINTTSQQRILRCKSSSGSGEVALYLAGATSLPAFYCDSQPGITNLSYANRTNLKMAGAYKNLDFGFSEGARLLNSNNSWNPPQFTSAEIGSVGGIGQFLTGQIKRLTYWPKRLPDGALQFITS